MTRAASHQVIFLCVVFLWLFFLVLLLLLSACSSSSSEHLHSAQKSAQEVAEDSGTLVLPRHCRTSIARVPHQITISFTEPCITKSKIQTCVHVSVPIQRVHLGLQGLANPYVHAYT